MLLRTSAEHHIEWAQPVFSRWAHSFKAAVRILWITEPDRIGLLQELEGKGQRDVSSESGDAGEYRGDRTARTLPRESDGSSN